MYRPRKSIVTAYLLWLLLGWVGGHRFYLGRPGTALFIALLIIGGGALYAYGVVSGDEKMQLAGILCAGCGGAGLVVDLFTIPGMVHDLNTRGQGEQSFIAPDASLDPSFQATMRKTGLEADEDGPQKSSLPDDYVLPWRAGDADKQAKKYDPGAED